MSSKPKPKDSRYIPRADRHLLWANSSGICSKKGCDNKCVVEATESDQAATIGQIAHIFAHSKDGPRPNPDGFTETTNLYENLILLCSTHHDLVDKQANTYTVTELKKWKEDHEAWVRRRLATEEFDNADLESIINWLSDEAGLPTDDFTIRPLSSKIQYNNLSQNSQTLITQGLMFVEEISGYVNNRQRYEKNFAQKLLNPLVNLYTELKNMGYNSDYIFDSLRVFACGNSIEYGKQSAGIALIAYFFERCEIFEK